MNNVYLNSIATAVPEFDIHQKFINYALASLGDEHDRALLKILIKRSQIEHRYSVLKSSVKSDLLDENNIYVDAKFPSTKERMILYEQNAFSLARKALDQLDLPSRKEEITHLIITTCTGFYAPGIDLQIIEHYGLKSSVERTIIGFMGCYAAINALKMARHIVSSEKSANVLIVNIELCTLHLQATNNVQDLLPFLIFADGCAASIVSAKKTGLELQSFYSTILANSRDQVMWHIGDSGFEMVLSSLVQKLIITEIPKVINEILHGKTCEDFAHFAIHPGGKAIIDAVEKGMGLRPELLKPSREVLRQFGNMSSAAIMFVLKEIMQKENSPGEGCAIAFGPGVALESMLFKKS
jgi:alpha-pyrone synthase